MTFSLSQDPSSETALVLTSKAGQYVLHEIKTIQDRNFSHREEVVTNASPLLQQLFTPVQPGLPPIQQVLPTMALLAATLTIVEVPATNITNRTKAQWQRFGILKDT